MKIEKQVTNLEISKRLKELGVKQDSIWYWFSYEVGEHKLKIYWDEDLLNPIYDDKYSAFTVAELGEIISKDYFSKKFGKDWICESEIGGGGDEYGEAVKSIYFQTKADTEADCRGKMLIYLIENKV